MNLPGRESERDYYYSSEASQWGPHGSWAFFYNNNEPNPMHQEHLCITNQSKVTTGTWQCPLWENISTRIITF